MIPNDRRPFFKKRVLIEGNCLFLVGPIGTFFARLSNYFEDNNPKFRPINKWRSHAHLLFGNWVNQIYQETPFNIEKIGKNKF